MATLASDQATLEQETACWAAPQQPWDCRLPPLPFEDVYLHRKLIDNSRLERARPGSAAPAYRRALVALGLVLGMVIVILLPNALQRVAERRLLVLEGQRQALLAERQEVESREAALLSPERLEQWARTLELVDPAPGQLQALSPKRDRTLAARVRSLQQRSVAPPAEAVR